jgi:hypothetical protein
MLVPLAYTVAKRLLGIRGSALRTFLTLHIYAGLIGPIFVVLHTGHKFDNPLGIMLTLMTLIVVLSGFVGRYLLQQTTHLLREKRTELAGFQPAFDAVRHEIVQQAEQIGLRKVRQSVFLRAVLPWAMRNHQFRGIGQKGVELAEAMAVIEVSILLHEKMRSGFRLWMRFHLGLTTILYLLLAAHIVIVAYYGLRWLPG